MTEILNEDLRRELGVVVLSEDTLNNRPNRYKGRCASCDGPVPAGSGFYNGHTLCSSAFLLPDYGYLCLSNPDLDSLLARVIASREAAAVRRAEVEARRGEIAAEAEAKRLARIASPEGQAEIARERARAADRKRRGVRVCRRCGGAGGSSQWDATGRVCYGCNGSGEVPNRVDVT